ncbi:recombination protein NinG [Citrobacter sp. Marseille-Q6884]|uniref:recombination protein NinG n=1 Tax=Citrobacter sp. Marseille-Q6884 TaxID=2956786 RepID=UPI0021B30346|nr:recombination protein NinG [Citrobacter sp. Marseille-Q6884]
MRKPTSRSCKICKTKFTAIYDNVWWCCPEHGFEYSQLLLAKKKLAAERKRKQEAQQERRELKVRKAALKPLSHWISITQRVFNDYIRARDGKVCISCGSKTAISYHAGHYRTTAAASQLRFNEDNCSSQCAACNVHKSGSITEYRSGLIKKIGLQRVLDLESDSRVVKYTKDSLAEIRQTYRKKLKEILND